VADQAAIDSVGQQFQAWAGGLSEGEQAVLAEWWNRASGDEVQGHETNWWQGQNAWSNAWQSAWSE
jgi:hypothetical protein